MNGIEEKTKSRGGNISSPGADKRSQFATVESLNAVNRAIDLPKGAARAGEHRQALFEDDHLPNPDAIEALIRLEEFVRDKGIDAAGPYRGETCCCAPIRGSFLDLRYTGKGRPSSM